MLSFASFLAELKVTDDIRIPAGSLGIPRNKLPQIESKDVDAFLEWLKKEKGVTTKQVGIPVGNLKMSQADINLEKVKGMIMTGKLTGKPIIGSNDGYIADGHHRFVALYNVDKAAKLETYRVDLPIKGLIAAMHEFPKSFTKEIHEAKKA